VYWEKMDSTWQPGGANVGSSEDGIHNSIIGLEMQITKKKFKTYLDMHEDVLQAKISELEPQWVVRGVVLQSI